MCFLLELGMRSVLLSSRKRVLGILVLRRLVHAWYGTYGLPEQDDSCFMPCAATRPRWQDHVHAGHVAATGDIRQGAAACHPSDPPTWDVHCSVCRRRSEE
jgi:hypothetical protein